MLGVLLTQSVRYENILPLTSTCNLRCLFCSNAQNPPGVEVFSIPPLPLPLVRRLIPLLNPHRKIIIGEAASRISEGEPLTHPEFWKIMIDSDCVYCGSCVAVCPVGALTEKGMIGKGRRWEVQKVKTVCPYCGTGCTIDLNVKDGRVIGVTGNPEGDVNGRFLCVKGRFGYQFIHSEDRLRTPLIKRNGKFEEATWDEAINLVAAKLKETKDMYGPDSIAVLSSARCTNEENYLLSKFTRAVIGTNNIDHCARL